MHTRPAAKGLVKFSPKDSPEISRKRSRAPAAETMMEPLAPAAHWGSFTDTTVPLLHSRCTNSATSHPQQHARVCLAGQSGRSEARAFSHPHNEAFVGAGAAPPEHPQQQCESVSAPKQHQRSGTLNARMAAAVQSCRIQTARLCSSS